MSSPIYAKNNDKEIRLWNFKIKNVIGNSRYGKIYKIMDSDTFEQFALKTIKIDKKDNLELVVLETPNDEYEDDYPFFVNLQYVF